MEDSEQSIEDYIESFYKKLSQDFIKNVNEDEKEEMQNAYIEYLHKNYDDYFYNYENHFKKPENKETILKNVTFTCSSSQKPIINLDRDNKRIILFSDPNYLKLKEISLEIFNIAVRKILKQPYNLTKTKKEYETEIDNIYKNISDLFKFMAGDLISETNLDLYFIYFEEDNKFNIFKRIRGPKFFSSRLSKYL